MNHIVTSSRSNNIYIESFANLFYQENRMNNSTNNVAPDSTSYAFDYSFLQSSDEYEIISSNHDLPSENDSIIFNDDGVSSSSDETNRSISSSDSSFFDNNVIYPDSTTDSFYGTLNVSSSQSSVGGEISSTSSTLSFHDNLNSVSSTT
uniref:A-agglutinin attachment subunit n=1 Tax=Parastrongyloides trichosuri TaxID=131310 RepID=A0A0N4Z7V1_PARTI